MLYTKSFSNYAEFQQIFGIREFDGRKTRKNKILLSLIKDPTIRKEAIKSGDYTLLSITNMTDLKQILTKKIEDRDPLLVSLSCYCCLLQWQRFS